MAVTQEKIIRIHPNCNSPRLIPDDKTVTPQQAALGRAVARPNLIRSGFIHISDPVRRILARVTSQVRERE